MTEPERPADRPAAASGPTPEEISARLEALLKRTHAMRQQSAAGQAGPMTWPPSARELDHFDVVDVPGDQRRPAAPAANPGAPAGLPSAGTPGGFERPDWGELRLRGAADEPAGVSRWWQASTVALALLAAGQGAYLWSRQTPPPTDVTVARLRVDGPTGAEVRIDGQRLGAAPIEHALAPGEHDVEIVPEAGARHVQRIAVTAGRTTVLLAPTGTPALPSTASPTLPPAAASAPTAAPRPATPTAEGLSPTLGAVLIESTPTGLPVTMEGRARGVTPITIGRLKPGRHDVLVGGLARQVDVNANSVATLRVTRP